MSRMKAIGIDLGTSKCCVGVVRDGKVEILENERGNKTTPSYVAFTDTERLIGEDAKDQATLNPANTVFGVKRIIGRELKDCLLGEAVAKMPNTIMNRSEEETCINVSYKKREELLLPQQIAAMLLGKMKDLAEHHLKSKVEEAVISVPASFSNAQRQATKDAATIAGLKVLALINEPTAAAIAYETNRTKTGEENVAVVDFGAGHLDAAVVTVRRDRVSVRSVNGSTAIGGNAIDEVLMKYVCCKFEDKLGQQLPESPSMTELLRSCCEKLKRKLTLLPRVQESMYCFGDDIVLPVNIKRNEFNSMISTEIRSSLKFLLDRVMQASRIPLKEISRVVLVGGSSRIPLFQTWLEEFFGLNSLDRSVNPDEAVAYGATLYAALLSGDHELDKFKLIDSFPHDYCFSSVGNTMQPVFGQNSSKTLLQQRVYPFKGQSPFNENTRKQKFEFHEELSGQKNPHRLIGTLCLDDEFHQDVSLITDVTFKIDHCGIFKAVVQLKPHHVFSEVLKNYAGKLNKDKLQNAVEREGQFRKDDQDERERVEAMSGLEALTFRLQSAMCNSKAKELFPEMVEHISDQARKNIEWLDVTNTVTKAECVKRQNVLEKLKNDLESKIKRYKKEENDRLAAVTSLESYCSFLKTSVGTGMAGETEFFAALGEQLEETTEWLKTSERSSLEECDDRIKNIKKVQVEMERKLKIKRREDERRSAVDDLLSYCTKLRAMKFEGKEFDFVRSDVRRLSEKNDWCMKYLSEIEFPSKAECDLRKLGLEKMVCEVEKQVERRRVSQLKSERLAAITSLQSRCTDLECLAYSIPYSDSERHPMAALGTETLNETRKWLRGPEAVTTEECDDRRKIMENCLNNLKEMKDRDHLACLDHCKSRFAYVEQTLLIELSWKMERGLCEKVIKTKDELFRCLETDNFSRENYDKKLAKFETAVGTLKKLVLDK